MGAADWAGVMTLVFQPVLACWDMRGVNVYFGSWQNLAASLTHFYPHPPRLIDNMVISTRAQSAIDGRMAFIELDQCIDLEFFADVQIISFVCVHD